jgi:hypothetical protein
MDVSIKIESREPGLAADRRRFYIHRVLELYFRCETIAFVSVICRGLKFGT